MSGLTGNWDEAVLRFLDGTADPEESRAALELLSKEPGARSRFAALAIEQEVLRTLLRRPSVGSAAALPVPPLPELDAQQRRVLKYVDSFWRKHRNWPTALDLRLDLSGEGINPDLVLSTLPHFVSFLDSLSGERTVRLTVAGALHGEDGAEIVEAFLTFLRTAARKVIESPSRSATVTKGEFRQLLPAKLASECDRISMLVLDTWWCSAGGGGLPDREWEFRCDQRVVRFHRVGTVEEFLHLRDRKARSLTDLGEEHVRLLSLIYRYRRMTARWPNYAALVVAYHAKADAEYLLEEVPERFARVINKYQATEGAYARLEFDAATVVPSAAPDLELLNPIVQVLCACFVEARGKRRISAEEVANKLGKPPRDVVRAGFFLQHDSATDVHIEEKDGSWVATPTEKVRKYEGARTTREFLARRKSQQLPIVAPDEPVDLGPWVCHKRLGGGGQASTYLVRRHDDADAKLFVMKVLKPFTGAEGKSSSESDQRHRFRNEVNALLEMNRKGCPRVASVVDQNLGPKSGQPWFVMPLYAGGPMCELDSAGKIVRYAEEYKGNIDRVLEITELVSGTLGFMHSHGAVHRDVKTANVFFDTKGGEPILGDFGLAHSPDVPKGFDTKEPEALGPWQSRPPELHPGSDDKRNPKSDVYLLGGLIYEALSGGKYIERPEHRPGEFVHEKPDFSLSQFTKDPRAAQVGDLLRCMWADDPNARLSAQQVADICREIRMWSPGAPHAVTRQRGLQLGQAAARLRDDIERLKNYTEHNALLLSERSSIRTSAGELKIERGCVGALLEAAEGGSLLVTGDPGAGKSGVLYELAQAKRSAGHHVVLIDVGRTEAPSLDALRSEIGLHHDLPTVLENWPGEKPAYLLVDALDAARSEPAARAVRDLVALVAKARGRWRVVASVRKFDLRHSRDLRSLFEGEAPSSFTDPEFRDLRHVNIPPLSDDELAAVAAPELAGLVAGSAAALRELLRNLFNLWLANELLRAGMKSDGLGPVSSQAELLDRYWEYRVVGGDGRGDDREALLRQACERMVSARSLRTQRAGLVEVGAGKALDELLSSNVLAEWQPSANSPPDRYVLAFSHHILFDFAVARVVFRANLEGAAARLESDPELVIAVRPSLMLLYGDLWSLDKDRTRFWDFVFRCAASKVIPEIGKLIGPGVAADLALSADDVVRVAQSLRDGDPSQREAAENVFRHLVGALVAGPRPLAGAGSGPWHSLAVKISENLRPPLCYGLRTLLYVISKQRGQLTREQLAEVNSAARNALAFVWDLVPRDRNLVLHFMDTVCVTFLGNPAASGAALRRALEPERVKAHGYEEIPELCRGVGHIVPADPQIVEEIYRVVFCTPLPDATPTPIGGSRILPMSSTRRQDWEHGQWELGQAFEGYLEAWPTHATRALIATLQGYAESKHPFSKGEGVRKIPWGEADANFLADGSGVWDSDSALSDVPHKMLEVWDRYVSGLAADPARRDRLDTILDALRGSNERAALWRRLIVIGTGYPQSLGKVLLPLMKADAVLSSVDTYRPVGRLIRAAFSHLDPSERLEVERAVIGVGHDAIRAYLLRCLPTEFASPEAKVKLPKLPDEQNLPDDEEEWKGGWGRGPGPDQGLPRQPGDQALVEAEAPVKAFLEKHRNQAPSPDDAAAIVPNLARLEDALGHADPSEASPHVVRRCWEVLAQSCERLTTVDGASCQEEPGRVVKRILLRASANQYPEPTADQDAEFSRGNGWAPEPRVVAAEGLIRLARHRDCVDAALTEAIERLGHDRVPAVRRQIAAHLLALSESAPDLMWRLVRELSRDPSHGVLRGLVEHTIGWLAKDHTEDTVELILDILARMTAGDGANAVREGCFGILLGVFVWYDHPACKDAIYYIVSSPAQHSELLMNMMWELREPATADPSGTAERVGVRARTLGLYLRIVKNSRSRLQSLEDGQAGQPFDAWPEVARTEAESLLKVLDSAATNLYFASGSYAESNDRRENKLTPSQRDRFYREAGEILDELAEVGFAAIAHHLIEILEECVEFDPRGVFLRVGRILRIGRRGGYEHESLAVTKVVKLIERYIAEHRALLRGDEDCRKVLMETLDSFVTAGWPAARRLTYRLEQIFR